MHHHLDVYAYQNRLRTLPPQQKLGFAIGVLLIALVSHPFTQLLIVMWLGIWIVGYARIPARIYANMLLITGGFLLTSLPALVISIVSVTQLPAVQSDAIGGIFWGNEYMFISRSGLVQAGQLALRSLACTSCLLFILFTIPFANLLQVLRTWHVPSLVTELLLLMYRFIFLFLDLVTEIQLAQRARGGYRSRRRWLFSVGLLISQLLVRSLQYYQAFSLALAARNFNGSFQVYTKQPHTYSKRYAIESLLGCMSLVILNFRI